MLSWANKTAWILCQPHFQDGALVPFDTRSQLQRALARLASHGLGMTCGLEVEFHIYRLQNPHHDDALNPKHAAWPGDAPAVSMIHPGYQLLSAHGLDACEEPLCIVQDTAQALGLPLASLEIEMGPSQVEAVFAPLTPSPRQTTWFSSEALFDRRLGERVTTPALSAARRFNTSCQADGTCTNPW